MTLWDIFTLVTCSAGLFFFAAGTVGLLRFPDGFTRLHALTKADNLGVGLIAIGLSPQVSSVFDGLQLLLIWVLVLASSAVTSFLVANFGLRHEYGGQPDEH